MLFHIIVHFGRSIDDTLFSLITLSYGIAKAKLILDEWKLKNEFPKLPYLLIIYTVLDFHSVIALLNLNLVSI